MGNKKTILIGLGVLALAGFVWYKRKEKSGATYEPSNAVKRYRQEDGVCYEIKTLYSRKNAGSLSMEMDIEEVSRKEIPCSEMPKVDEGFKKELLERDDVPEAFNRTELGLRYQYYYSKGFYFKKMASGVYYDSDSKGTQITKEEYLKAFFSEEPPLTTDLTDGQNYNDPVFQGETADNLQPNGNQYNQNTLEDDKLEVDDRDRPERVYINRDNQENIRVPKNNSQLTPEQIALLQAI